MRTIFLVGTAYSGSTALSREFARDPRIDMMGEIDRLSVFQPWSGREDAHIENRCRVCFMGEQTDACPVFNGELAAEASQGSLAERYAAVRRRFPAQIALDGSKNPNWMRSVVAESPGMQAAAIVLARLPWAFAHSVRDADGLDLSQGVARWRDAYQSTLRIVADLGIPSLVIRYEDFLMNRADGEAAVSRLFGFRPQPTRPAAVGVHHAIGGNLGGFVGMRGVDERALEKSISGEARAGNYENPNDAFKVQNPALRTDELVLTERWRGELTVAEFSAILHVPGVWETGRLLGYDLLYHLTR